MNLFLVSWEVTSVLEQSSGGEDHDSLGYISSRVKLRARKALERIYKATPVEVIETIIAYWEKVKSSTVSSQLSLY